MSRGKLVRDRIPEFAKNRLFIQASVQEYEDLLRAKLREEVEEFLQTPSIEEMADIIEVLHAFCGSLQISFEEMEKVRSAKAKDKGTFCKRLILIDEVS